MNKVEKIITTIFIIIIFYLTKDINILPLTISLSMYILFYSIFSTTSIKPTIEQLSNQKKHSDTWNIFKYSILIISLLGIFLITISYLIGTLINIEKLNIINIFMSISLIINIILKIMKEYLEVVGYKKLGKNIITVKNIITFAVLSILSILLFKVLKFPNYINYILIYLVDITISAIIILLIYIKKFNKKRKQKTKENINIIKLTKKIIICNQTITIYNVVRSTYLYFSIIILYYTLINKYNYSYELVGNLLSNTFLYSLMLIMYIYKNIKNNLNINYNDIKETLNSNINNIIKTSLKVVVFLTIISIPLNNILFSSDYNYISYLVPILSIYILYDYIVNINIKYIKNKNATITMLIGLVTKIIFELPLINTIYRMGYSLILGSIISSILGFIISIIIGLILIKNKYKILLLDNFNNILNIIYESIIYTFIMILSTIIIKLEANNIMGNIIIIISYIFLTILLNIIKRLMRKK